MRFVIFTHSLVSDWNHGNAHFLRGVTTELARRGHEVRVLEPAHGWSRTNLVVDGGEAALIDFHRAYPLIGSTLYNERSIDLSAKLRGADVVIVHEWNSHELVRRIGQHHATHKDYVLLFHDTHHRSVTDPASMRSYDLTHYDGVLAFGEVIKNLYLENGWATRAWTWHEAADLTVFHPRSLGPKQGDLVWIGNWGDGERSEELREFLIEPVKRLNLTARVYGVRYPRHALEELRDAGIEYGGWLPNYKVPEVFARYRVTVHVPRRPYTDALPGIPTIRPFEAMACGIPLVSAPWNDAESLFTAGEDYLVAANGEEMTAHLERILLHPYVGRELISQGLNTIQSRHTCAHRVDELTEIISNCPERALAGSAV